MQGTSWWVKLKKEQESWNINSVFWYSLSVAVVDSQFGNSVITSSESIGEGERQPSSKSVTEPKAEAHKRKQPNHKDIWQIPVLRGGQLAEDLGDHALARHLRRSLRLQIHPIPPPCRVQDHGLLRLYCQRRSRNSQVQHGAHFAPCLPQHHHLASQQNQIRRHSPLRRQSQFPQGKNNFSNTYFQLQ